MTSSEPVNITGRIATGSISDIRDIRSNTSNNINSNSSSSSSSSSMSSRRFTLAHITVEWRKNYAQLTERLGVHANYLSPQFYAMPFDYNLPPQILAVIHFGDRGDNSKPGYAVQRMLHHDLYPLPHVEMCFGFVNTHDTDSFVIKAGTPLDKVFEHDQIQSCILYISTNEEKPLTSWDFM